MQTKTHVINDIKIAEVVSPEIIVRSAEDGLDLLGNLYYQGFDSIAMYERNLIPEFFNLKNGIAGEILQKFSNYRVRLAVIGDFSAYSNKSVQDFIYESNKSGHINFVPSLEIALVRLSNK
ncbi:DUF4180 domain-containing protein [Olivibacter ginsenosidimutans]|uniref:DUF4180 domain-containing protein n=1 Tax=Olivibacter ginsenosidimutans TaxID=1176537 RepID=A0ABP9BG49_9SPHI